MTRTINTTVPDYEMPLVEFIHKYNPTHPPKAEIIANWYEWAETSKQKWMSDAIEAARRKHAPELETRHEPFETYDVVSGRCFNTRGNPMAECEKYIEDQLHARDLDPDEYITFQWAPEVWPVYDVSQPEGKRLHRFIVYYVRGGSEGHYIHAEYTTRDGQLHPILFIKTCAEDQHRAQAYANALSEIIGV